MTRSRHQIYIEIIQNAVASFSLSRRDFRPIVPRICCRIPHRQKSRPRIDGRMACSTNPSAVVVDRNRRGRIRGSDNARSAAVSPGDSSQQRRKQQEQQRRSGTGATTRLGEGRRRQYSVVDLADHRSLLRPLLLRLLLLERLLSSRLTRTIPSYSSVLNTSRCQKKHCAG